MSTIRHYNVALLSESASLPFADLAAPAAALSTQMSRDLAAHWNVSATVTAFPAPSAVPTGFYTCTVQDNINAPGADGYHTNILNQAYALIQSGDGWTVTASHEICELLCDPWGSRLYPGTINGQSVQVLEEVCDPVENFSYEINGVAVSDFVLPEYYSGVAMSNHKYSFLGNVSSPWEVASEGYISYVVNNEWWQITNFGGLQTTDLGPATEVQKGFKTLKEAVDYWGAVNHKSGYHAKSKK
jgi:hypothetical protein